MKLDKKNGALQIEQITLTAMLPISRFMTLFEGYSIISGAHNLNYSSYSIRNLENNDIAISVLFNNERLQSVSIGLGSKYGFPPFERTVEEKNVLQTKLNNMGGANTYPWGTVELSDDNKGGTLSIVINYK